MPCHGELPGNLCARLFGGISGSYPANFAWRALAPAEPGFSSVAAATNS